MRKNDLIKLLQDLPGNPEIKLWNGLVGDVVDIKQDITQVRLVKQSSDDYIERCRIEECRDRNDWRFQFTSDEIAGLSKNYKKHSEWELNEYVDSDRIKNKDYKQKIIYVIDAKIMNKKCYDRLGKISY